MAVRWYRSAFLQLALFIALAVRTVYAAPAGSVAQLRAACCCATHCSHCAHRPGALQSDQCCRVASGANDAAVLASPFALHPPPAVPRRNALAQAEARVGQLAGQTKGGPQQRLLLERQKIRRLIEDIDAGRSVDPSEIDRALQNAERGF